ncbi:MAG: LPXTG cell wall anchor domain-containing protein, partial [Erysipelotrichaceae bacterium]|nr:LPXTG cell wall anchor domain-containing protein [Erysipelotrichaceae bacterium]
AVAEKEFTISKVGENTPDNPVVVPTPPTGGTITNPDGTPGPEVNPGDNIESNGPVIENPDGSITFPEGGTITKPDGSEEIIQPGGTLKPNEPEVVPTPPTGGTITNPDGTPGPEVNPGDDIESNGPVVENPDGSITFPNGGTITKPDGSIEIIQPGATLKPNGKEEIVQPEESVNGAQTGDKTQVGLWSILAGLSTGMMMFFRRKRKKEE